MYFLLILCRDGVSSMPNLTEQRIHVFGFLDAVQRITKQQSFSMSECSKPLPPSFKLKQHVKLLFCNLYILISFWRIRTDDRQSDVELLQHVSSIHVAYLPATHTCPGLPGRLCRSACLYNGCLRCVKWHAKTLKCINVVRECLVMCFYTPSHEITLLNLILVLVVFMLNPNSIAIIILNEAHTSKSPQSIMIHFALYTWINLGQNL